MENVNYFRYPEQVVIELFYIIMETCNKKSVVRLYSKDFAGISRYKTGIEGIESNRWTVPVSRIISL